MNKKQANDWIRDYYPDGNVIEMDGKDYVEWDQMLDMMAQLIEWEKCSTKPEFETCGHCGWSNCRNNDTCINCDKPKTWIT